MRFAALALLCAAGWAAAERPMSQLYAGARALGIPATKDPLSTESGLVESAAEAARVSRASDQRMASELQQWDFTNTAAKQDLQASADDDAKKDAAKALKEGQEELARQAKEVDEEEKQAAA